MSNETRMEERPLLIKSETCPACRAASVLLDKAGVDYDIMSDADTAYGETVERYGVRHVPTLILRSVAGWKALSGTDAIKEYIQTR